jgi:hypothetical protein
MTPRHAPPPVTAARVIIYVISAFSTLWAVAQIVFGVVGLASGASLVTGSAGTRSSEIGSLFGGLVGALSGLAVVGGLVSLAFVGLWAWAATALGRASAAARIVVTILCGIPVVLLLILQFAAAADGSGSSSAFVVGVAGSVPGLIIILLWAPTSSRSYFAPHRIAPPVARRAVPLPRLETEPVTTPLRRPTLCARCRTAVVPGGAFCGGCGTPVATRVPVRR